MGTGMQKREQKNAYTGPTRAEVTFTSQKSGRMMHINTVETRPNRFTPTRREREAARRLVQNGQPGDIIVLNPKVARIEDFKSDALAEFIDPLLAELDKPPPPHGTDTEFPWYEWVPHT